MKRGMLALSMLAVVLSLLAGCAVAHRYPVYRGKVLELGTDQPIEGAGVLAVYEYKQLSVTGGHDAFLGYQAVLTNSEGKFVIPTVWFTEFMPFSRFLDDVSITIYKKGYGNFPASFHEHLRKHGMTDIPLKRNDVPPDREVTFWLPRLGTAAEIVEHEWYFSSALPSELMMGHDFPPPGTRKNQFLSPKYLLNGDLP